MIISEETPNHSIFLLDLKREIEAILFDMDGVLVDSIPSHIKAWNSALSENNLPALDRKTYLSMLGRTNFDMITRYLDLHNKSLPLPLKKNIIDTKERFFRYIIKEEIKTAPGVIKWLDFFKKKQIRCSVASSGEMANIAVILEMLHISDYFTSIISGAHLPAGKPNPMVFMLAAASLGVKPDKCMVIEDAPAGIQAAKSANMLCCALATTFSSDELKKADLLLENLAQARPETLFSD
jgi:HAD superfamily hydrolase (TIGR01509 family)